MTVLAHKEAAAAVVAAPRPDTREVTRMCHNPSARVLSEATDLTVEGVAMVQAELDLIANFKTPEHDSVIERILRWHLLYDLPDHEVVGVVEDLKQLRAMNGEEAEIYRRIAGQLGTVATVSTAPEMEQALTVRGALNLLREPLKLLVASEAGTPVDGRALVDAVAAVRRVAAVAPHTLLLGKSMKTNLGGRKFEALKRVVEAAA